MALVIVSAKNIKEAYEKSLYKKEKEAYIVEDNELQDFFFFYKDSFKYYEYYYKLNPDGISKIDAAEVIYVKLFAENVMKFIENNNEIEDIIIDKFNVSKTKVRKYIEKLIKLSDFAIKNCDELIGLGDW